MKLNNIIYISENKVIEYSNGLFYEQKFSKKILNNGIIYNKNEFITKYNYFIKKNRIKKLFHNKNKIIIYNGNIYINTDIASIDSPLHEIMHLLLGSIKFSNPDLYYNLVSLSEQFTGYDKLIKTFKNRTKSDINEELFVTEFSRFMMGEDSILSELDENTMYEISYNVHRLLDSILMGNYSSNKISSNIYSLSLK